MPLMVCLIVHGQKMVLLSPRETDILLLTTEGRISKEIADQLGIPDRTVKRVTEHMRSRLRFGNSRMLAAWAASRPQVFERKPVSPEPFRISPRPVLAPLARAS